MISHLPTVFETTIKRATSLLPELSHVEPSRILVLVHRMAVSRQGQTMGLRQARGGRAYEPVYPQVTVGGREVRYVMAFNPRICIPGILHSYDPIETVIHELWHLSPACDGTIRRMRHGKTFNGIVRELATAYRERGGEELPKLCADDTVCLRQWRARKVPSTAYVRRIPGVNVTKALHRMNWKEEWTGQDLIERERRLGELLPVTHRYVCPNGHEIETHVRFVKPRSCASCAPTFDRRFLYRPIATENRP